MVKKRITLALISQIVAETINKIVPLVVLHFVVQRIGAEGFGYAKFAYGLIDLTIPFIVMGYTYVGAIEIGRTKSDQAETGRIISEILFLKAFHGAIAATLLITIVCILPSWQKYLPVVLILSFNLATTVLDMSHVHVGTTRMFSLGNIVSGVKLVCLVMILMFVNGREDATLFAFLYFGSNGFISIVSFFVIRGRYQIRWPGKAALISRFKSNLPYALVAFWTISIARWDLIAAESFSGTEGAGLYGGPMQIVQAIQNLVNVIHMVFFAEIVGATTRESLNRIFHIGSFAVLAIIAPIIAGTWFVDQQLLVFVLGESFGQQNTLFSILICTTLTAAMINLFGVQILLVKDRVKVLNITMGLALSLGVLLSFVLFPEYGLAGIAGASLIAQSIAALTLFVFAKSELASIPWMHWLRIAGSAGLMAAVLSLIPDSNLFMKLSIGVAGFTIFFLVFNRTKFFQIVSALRQR